MDPTHIKGLFDARQAAVSDLRALDRQADGRTFTPSEQDEYRRLTDLIDSYDERIKNGLEAASRKAKADEARAASPFVTESRAIASEQADAFRSLIPSRTEYRDITTTSAAAVVPERHASTLIEYIMGQSQVAGLCSRFTTQGANLVIPRMTVGVTAAMVAEAGTIGESDPTFSPLDVTIQKAGVRTQITAEAWADSDPSVREAVGRDHVRQIAALIDAQVLAGSGVSPQVPGILTDATIAAAADTIGVANAPTLDELHDAIAGLLAEGLDISQVTVVLPAAWWAAVTKAKDLENRYLLGAPGDAAAKSVFGAKVVVSSALTTDAVVGAFDYAALVVRKDLETRASEHFAWDQDMVDLRTTARFGFGVVDPSAFQVLSNPGA